MSRRTRNKPPKERKEATLRRAHYRCELAGPNCTQVADTVDHWVPRAQGGVNAMTNLKAACRPCNIDKSDMAPAEWQKFVRASTSQLAVQLRAIAERMAA